MTFPAELRDEVLALLPRDDLVNLARTSRAWYEGSSLWIYRSIDLRYYQFSEGKWYKIYLLLRTLISRRDLAILVRSLSIASSEHDARCPDVDGLNLVQLQVLDNLIDDAQLEGSSTWKRGVRERDVNAFLALVVSQCFNLESLALSFEFQNSKFLTTLLTHTGSLCFPDIPISSFKSLVDVQFYNKIEPHQAYDLEDQYHENHVLFDQPNIKTIYTVMIDLPSLVWRDKLPCHSLRSLSLSKSRLSAAKLKRLLQLTPHLEELDFNMWVDVEPDGDEDFEDAAYVRASDIRQAIEHLNPSLKRLSLSIDFFTTTSAEIGNGGEFGVLGHLGSLRSFEELEYLEVSAVLLLGTSVAKSPPLQDLLPTKLRQLILRDDLSLIGGHAWGTKAFIRVFEDFTANRKATVPHLDTIGLVLNHTWSQPTVELENLCSNADMNFTVIRP